MTLWGLLVNHAPVNDVDPRGLYSGGEVHRDLTERLVSEIAKSYGVERICDKNISKLISKYDKLVDDSSVLSSVSENPYTSHGCRRCHFCDWDDTKDHIEDAINPLIYGINPYYFGAALHQVQDYFSHWNEGYREDGHAGHTTRRIEKLPSRRSDFFRGGHTIVVWDEDERELTTEWVESPYPAHPEEDVRRYLQRTNPGVRVSELGQNELIDLYLRKDEGRDPNWLKRVEMRDHFGFDADMYIPGSWRDNLMEWHTRYYIKKFIEATLADPCAVGCREPEDNELRKFLTK